MPDLLDVEGNMQYASDGNSSDGDGGSLDSMPGVHGDHSDENMDSTDDDETGWSAGSGAFAMLNAAHKAMVCGPLSDEARALARAAVARALARGEAEALPAEVAVADWRGLFALALRALRAAARTQRLHLEHLDLGVTAAISAGAACDAWREAGGGGGGDGGGGGGGGGGAADPADAGGATIAAGATDAAGAVAAAVARRLAAWAAEQAEEQQQAAQWSNSK